jgi:hypothetical protein
MRRPLPALADSSPTQSARGLPLQLTEVGLGRQEAFSKILVRTPPRPVPPLSTPSPRRPASRLPDPSQAEIMRTEPRRAAIRRDDTSRDPPRLDPTSKSSGANLTLGTRRFGRFDSRNQPERKVVATDLMSRIDVKGSSQMATVDVGVAGKAIDQRATKIPMNGGLYTATSSSKGTRELP